MRHNEHSEGTASHEHSGILLSRTHKIVVCTSNGCLECPLLRRWLKEQEKKNRDYFVIQTVIGIAAIVIGIVVSILH